MAIKRIDVTIQGKSALLMHAFPMVEIKGLEKKSPKEQAEFSAYRDGKGRLCFPAVNIGRSIVAGATYSKGKGKGSLQKPVAACLLVTPEKLDLGTKDYQIDSRPVVIKATKGRIVRHRPRLDEWRLTFEIEFDDDLLSENQMRQCVDDAGSRVGIGDFRPECKGPFGRFVVVNWESIE